MASDEEWDQLEQKIRAMRISTKPVVVIHPVSVELARRLLVATCAPRDYTFEQLVEYACKLLEAPRTADQLLAHRLNEAELERDNALALAALNLETARAAIAELDEYKAKVALVITATGSGA